MARYDCSVDAKKGELGIGLKTWIGNDDQKVAEFGKLRENYKNLSGIELIKTISLYRNERIRVTKRIHGIDKMIYHIIKRIPGAMQIIEHSFDYIDIDNLSIIKNRGNINNTYFNDGNHTYHFSKSKNTLYMLFENKEILDCFEVDIMTDPYEYLMHMFTTKLEFKSEIVTLNTKLAIDRTNKLCLRLYSTKIDGTKYVPPKSGLNQWNASGRERNPNEIYIAYQKDDRNRNLFFSHLVIHHLHFTYQMVQIFQLKFVKLQIKIILI